MARTVRTEPLTAEGFRSFGFVVSADREGASGRPANQGTARRFDWLGDVENRRPGSARLNLCVFRCAPRTAWPLRVDLLEQHRLSTQVMIPVDATRYVVLVAEPTAAGEPDPATLRAFLAGPRQGVAYFPGTWHHPLLALDRETDFTCAVWEDGSPDDCTVVDLDAADRPLVALDDGGRTGT